MVPAAPRDSPCRSDNTGISLDPVQGEEFIDNLLGCHNKDKFPSKFLNSHSIFGLITLWTGIEQFALGKPAQTGPEHPLSSAALRYTWGLKSPPSGLESLCVPRVFSSALQQGPELESIAAGVEPRRKETFWITLAGEGRQHTRPLLPSYSLAAEPLSKTFVNLSLVAEIRGT